jgi:hypothetical protein
LVEGTPASGSPLQVPLLYVVGSIAAINVLGRRASAMGPARVLVLVLAAMQTILFFAAATPEFRFQYFQVVLCVCLCSMVLALHVPVRRGSGAAYRGSRRPLGSW